MDDDEGQVRYVSPEHFGLKPILTELESQLSCIQWAIPTQKLVNFAQSALKVPIGPSNFCTYQF
jgi:hypothetical protein